MNFLYWSIIPVSVILLLLSACSKPPYFENEHHFDGSWSMGDTVTYRFGISDTATVFDVDLHVHFDHEIYPYQNLYVKTITTFPDGEAYEQLLSLNLFTRIGYVEGPCKGSECIVEIPLQQQVFFPHAGQYILQIMPWMRIDEISGIHSLVLRLTQLDMERSHAEGADQG